MGIRKQLWLPPVKEIKKIAKKRRLPQPRVVRFRSPRKFELLHRPFDLRFRGNLNKWLEQIQAKYNLALDEVLDDYHRKIIELYFYPQKPNNKWLNQKEVLEKINETSKRKLKASLMRALIEIWLKIKR